MNSVTVMEPDSADLYDSKLTRFKSCDVCGMYLPGTNEGGTTDDDWA